MKRTNVKKLIKQYIDDGFKLIDLELYNGEVLGLNLEEIDFIFATTHECEIHTKSKIKTIKYSDIKNIAF